MKKIAISMNNGLFAEGISLAMQKKGEFDSRKISSFPEENILGDCLAFAPEILLLDVCEQPLCFSLSARISLIQSLRRKLPFLKAVLLCDECA